MKTLLALTPAPTTAAATRFRVEQFRPALRAVGVDLVLRPFLDDRAFGVLYQPGQTPTKMLLGAEALARRVTDLVAATSADAILVHREAALIGPPLIEWAIGKVLKRPLIFDLDDPIWVPYVSPTYGALLSRLTKMPGKTDRTLRFATIVIAGNPHVAAYAARFSARVELIPTVVDTSVFQPADTRNPVPVIGWIGTHSAAPYLRLVLPALRRLAAAHRFVLRVIGGDVDARGIPTETQPWSLGREVADFQSIDIGLYPLVDDPWSRGKSGFKAVQYMACGKPVVASPVGVTREMIDSGETGFLVDTDDAWYEALRALVLDAGLRARLGSAGRARAEARWSLAVHAPRFVDVVLRAMAGSKA